MRDLVYYDLLLFEDLLGGSGKYFTCIDSFNYRNKLEKQILSPVFRWIRCLFKNFSEVTEVVKKAGTQVHDL